MQQAWALYLKQPQKRNARFSAISPSHDQSIVASEEKHLRGTIHERWKMPTEKKESIGPW